MFKSGFISIIGRPNVGKSTLLNAIVNEHLSIISPVAQTTRNNLKGIYTDDKMQIVFIDTPGIHKPKNELGSFMNKQSYSSLNDSDLILWIVDSSEEFGGGDRYLVNILETVKPPVILVLNKIDKVEISSLEYIENKNNFVNSLSFLSNIEISALEKIRVDTLMDLLYANLSEGPAYYDENQLTDTPIRFIVGEIIREKIFMLTRQEVPHSVAVVIDDMKETEDLTTIMATIYVSRTSQRGIILGSGGKMIKNIKKLAKRDIALICGTKVDLDLWVKASKNWQDNKNILGRLGYK